MIAAPSHMLCIMGGVFTSSRNEFNENTTAPDSKDCANPTDLTPREEDALVKVCCFFVGRSVDL